MPFLVRAREWLRRHDPALNEHLRTYLFKEGDILAIEEAATAEGGSRDEGSLGIGNGRED